MEVFVVWGCFSSVFYIFTDFSRPENFESTVALHRCSLAKRNIHAWLLEMAVFSVAQPQLHLYRSQIIDPKPKGRQPLLAFALLVCSYCPVCKKIKLQSLRYIHHLTFLARAGSVRQVCGDLEEIFWSSAYSVLKRHQEKLHWFFSFGFS